MPQYIGNINQTDALSNTGRGVKGHAHTQTHTETVHVNVAENHRENAFKCNLCYGEAVSQLST